MLEGFYRTPLMHQFKNLSIQRPVTAAPDQRRDDLDINLTVEAIIVNGTSKRPQLMPLIDRRLVALDVVSSLRGAPAGLGMALWGAAPSGPAGPRVLADTERNYAAIAAKNIFFGSTAPATQRPPEPEAEVLKFVKLVSIDTDLNRYDKRREAALYDVWNNEKSRLRSGAGFNTFPILKSSPNTLVIGEVIRIDPLDLVFRVALNGREPEGGAAHYKDREEIYRLHKDDVDDLIKEGAVRSDQIKRLYWVDPGRWQALTKEKMVTVTGHDFAFRWGLVRGRLIRDDSQGIVLLVDEKYCAYSYEGARARAHEGYCRLHIGDSLADALKKPLDPSDVKKLKEKLAAKP